MHKIANTKQLKLAHMLLYYDKKCPFDFITFILYSNIIICQQSDWCYKWKRYHLSKFQMLFQDFVCKRIRKGQGRISDVLRNWVCLCKVKLKNYCFLKTVMATKMILKRWTIILSFIFTLTINDQANYIFIPIKHDSPWTCCFRGTTLYYHMYWCFTSMENKIIKTLNQYTFPISGFHIIYQLMIGNINRHKMIHSLNLLKCQQYKKFCWLQCVLFEIFRIFFGITWENL